MSQKYTINTNSTTFKLFCSLVTILMLATIFWPAISGTPSHIAEAGEVNTTPAYESLQLEGETKKAEAEKQLQQAEKIKELCSLDFEQPELCGSHEKLNKQLEHPVATPEDSLKAEGSAIPTQEATSLTSTFTEFAKANPWRGATFPEGNHLQITKANIARYENIPGCHPYLLASMHYSETGLQMTNGSNGQGVFQAYSSKIRYPANSTVTDFKEQATRACEHIRSKVGGLDLSSLEDINLIGKALALYNGCYSPGIRAYARGDYGTTNGWDKCPYTANYLTNNEPMLQCAVDGCRKHNTRQIYGTVTFIIHLQLL